MIHQNKPENNVAQFSWSIFRYAPQISVLKSKCGPKVSEKAFGLCPLDPAPLGPKFDSRSVPKNGPRKIVEPCQKTTDTYSRIDDSSPCDIYCITTDIF